MYEWQKALYISKNILLNMLDMKAVVIELFSASITSD